MKASLLRIIIFIQKQDSIETGVAVPNEQSKPISMGSAVNTKLVKEICNLWKEII